MTLKEADEIARKCLPVINDGIEYRRICETGYRYDEHGNRSGYVVLLDRYANSVTRADPARCKLKEETDERDNRSQSGDDRREDNAGGRPLPV